jgi:ABC-type enterochelin transport system substrate-binding protein
MKIRFLFVAFVVMLAVAGCGGNSAEQEAVAQNSSIGQAAGNAASK